MGALLGILAALIAGPLSSCDEFTGALGLVQPAGAVAYPPGSALHAGPTAADETCAGHAYLHRKSAATVALRHVSPAMPADWSAPTIPQRGVPERPLPPQTGPPQTVTVSFTPRGPPAIG